MAEYEGYCVKCREKRTSTAKRSSWPTGAVQPRALPDLRDQDEPHPGQEVLARRGFGHAPGARAGGAVCARVVLRLYAGKSGSEPGAGE